jgi:hypothetical protein
LATAGLIGIGFMALSALRLGMAPQSFGARAAEAASSMLLYVPVALLRSGRYSSP